MDSTKNKEVPSTIVYNINEHFKVPIYYNNERVELKKKRCIEQDNRANIEILYNRY